MYCENKLRVPHKIQYLHAKARTLSSSKAQMGSKIKVDRFLKYQHFLQYFQVKVVKMLGEQVRGYVGGWVDRQVSGWVSEWGEVNIVGR